MTFYLDDVKIETLPGERDGFLVTLNGHREPAQFLPEQGSAVGLLDPLQVERLTLVIPFQTLPATTKDHWRSWFLDYLGDAAG